MKMWDPYIRLLDGERDFLFLGDGDFERVLLGESDLEGDFEVLLRREFGPGR